MTDFKRGDRVRLSHGTTGVIADIHAQSMFSPTRYTVAYDTPRDDGALGTYFTHPGGVTKLESNP